MRLSFRLITPSPNWIMILDTLSVIVYHYLKAATVRSREPIVKLPKRRQNRRRRKVGGKKSCRTGEKKIYSRFLFLSDYNYPAHFCALVEYINFLVVDALTQLRFSLNFLKFSAHCQIVYIVAMVF